MLASPPDQVEGRLWAAGTSWLRHLGSGGTHRPTRADCAVPPCLLVFVLLAARERRDRYEKQSGETGLISMSTRFLICFKLPPKKVTQKVTTLLKMANMAVKGHGS